MILILISLLLAWTPFYLTALRINPVIHPAIHRGSFLPQFS